MFLGKLGEISQAWVKFEQKWCLKCLDLKKLQSCFFTDFVRANLRRFAQKFFAPAKICLLLHLCIACIHNEQRVWIRTLTIFAIANSLLRLQTILCQKLQVFNHISRSN